MTYNTFDNLELNVKSIASQTMQNYEVLLADDCSSNFDEEYIISLFKKYHISNYTIFHHEKNLGTVKNYDYTISHACGKYIVPLSQDDQFYDNNSLQLIVTQFINTNCDFVYSKRIGVKSKMVCPSAADCEIIMMNNLHLLYKRILLTNIICGACFCIKKNSYYDLGGFDKDFFLVEDYPLVINAILKNKYISFVNEITVKYGETGVSTGKKKSKVLLHDYRRIMEKYILPNINTFQSRLAKEYILDRYYLFTHNNTKLSKFISYVKFYKLTLLKIRLRFSKQQTNDVIKYILENDVTNRNK